MSSEIAGAMTLVLVVTRALVAKGVLEKEDLLAELSRMQGGLPASIVAPLQELILNLPDQ